MIEKLQKEERGDLLVIFAVLFSVLILVIALSADFAVLYARRAKIYEIGHVMRSTRFTKGQEYFMNNDNPGREYAEVFNKYAKLNGFNGKFKVTYNEDPIGYDEKKRRFDIDMEFEENVETIMLKYIGISQVPIKVLIKGRGNKEIKGSLPIWRPNNHYYRNYEAVFEKGNKISERN